MKSNLTKLLFISRRLLLLESAMHGVIVLLLLLIIKKLSSLPLSLKSFNDSWPPMPITEYVKGFGYDLDSHDVITEDGYILTYHRLACRSPPCHQRPVLLQHGMMAASDVWLMKQDALAFLLADSGFDVWLGNSRGNSYARKHIKYDPEKDGLAFWDFSFHEMGYFDLAAGLDYITNLTGSDRVLYVGHSLGTSLLFVLANTRPQYLDKVHTSVLMAPVANLTHIYNRPGLFVNQVFRFAETILKRLGRHSFLSYSYGVFWLDQHICANEHLKWICKYFIFSIFGFDEEEYDEELALRLLDYQPSGLSFKTYDHVNQLHQTGFNQYDYGPWANRFRYGSTTPPKYDLSKVTCPTHVFYARNDGVTTPQDVLEAVSQLPNVQSLTVAGDKNFNHVDFLWGLHSRTIVSDKVVSILLKSQEVENLNVT